MGPTSPRESWSFDGQRIGLPRMDVSHYYLEPICVLLGIGFAVSAFWCLRGESLHLIRQAIVSCGLALIFLAGLVPQSSSQIALYVLILVAFCISVAGIRIFIYGRRLQLSQGSAVNTRDTRKFPTAFVVPATFFAFATAFELWKYFTGAGTNYTLTLATCYAACGVVFVTKILWRFWKVGATRP